jgi:hypothetical protein
MKSIPATEESIITQIRSELDQVRSTLLPSVDVFLRNITIPPSQTQHPESVMHQPLNDSEIPVAVTQSLEKEHTRLGELLLQSLLRLDAITTDGTWEDARAERKGAVQEVQRVLDRLDSEWNARPPALRTTE